MDWQDYIHSVPGILSGKPVIKGTRISVELILRLLAEGWTEAQILDNYEGISPEALRSFFVFAAEGLTEDKVYQFG
ncbi:MAG: DUF433 domain-containing protein [Bacteroidota bacterium]|nr:DUF433 domain-containing protein [Bacteroidota bacterium]MDP4232158.1 DUF433 domain-containing protein [Bacteroidota bacterium]MDP4241134.1 DUF433 domain-containing protein [Bacteroidota bacterium]MDP4286526.1 DUF433 domain-containing protein [Bacteroidota bacterium]